MVHNYKKCVLNAGVYVFFVTICFWLLMRARITSQQTRPRLNQH